MEYVDQRWAGFADAAGKYLRSISFDASGSSATYGASATEHKRWSIIRIAQQFDCYRLLSKRKFPAAVSRRRI
jgi:hypothetical protein